MDIETIIKILNALIPISITILGTYIAYQQWLTNERKRKQDLFELRRRYIYSNSMELLYSLPGIAKGALNNKLSNDSLLFKYSRYYREYGYLLKPEDSEKILQFYAEIMKALFKIIQGGLENYEKNVKDYELNTQELLRNNLNEIAEKYLRIENDNLFKRLFNFLCNKIKLCKKKTIINSYAHLKYFFKDEIKTRSDNESINS